MTHRSATRTAASIAATALVAALLVGCGIAPAPQPAEPEPAPTDAMPTGLDASNNPWYGLSFDVTVGTDIPVQSGGVTGAAASYGIVDGNPNIIIDYTHSDGETKRNYLSLDLTTAYPFELDYREGEPSDNDPVISQYMHGYLIGNPDGTGIFEPYQWYENSTCPANLLGTTQSLGNITTSSDGRIQSFTLTYQRLNDSSMMLGLPDCSTWVYAEYPLTFTRAD